MGDIILLVVSGLGEVILGFKVLSFGGDCLVGVGMFSGGNWKCKGVFGCDCFCSLLISLFVFWNLFLMFVKGLEFGWYVMGEVIGVGLGLGRVWNEGLGKGLNVVVVWGSGKGSIILLLLFSEICVFIFCIICYVVCFCFWFLIMVDIEDIIWLIGMLGMLIVLFMGLVICLFLIFEFLWVRFFELLVLMLFFIIKVEFVDFRLMFWRVLGVDLWVCFGFGFEVIGLGEGV